MIMSILNEPQATYADRPDYVGDLLDLAREARTHDEVAALWAAAQRVVDDTQDPRRRLRELRTVLQVKSALLA